MIWNGSRERLALFFHQINNLAPGMRVIMEIDDFSAVFLDCRFHKGIGWLQMQTLDVELYTKASNYYLYKPFDSAAPIAQYQGVILGELIRLIKRDSCVLAYVEHADLFYLRLRDRGYPPGFLKTTFATAPSWSQRDQLLTHSQNGDSASVGVRTHAFVIPYSRELEQSNLSRDLRSSESLLPPHLRDGRILVAWRAARALGRALIPYCFSSLRFE